MVTCKECNYECSAHNGLSFHLRSAHKMKYDVYVVKHEFNGVWPTCKNCQEPLKRKPGSVNNGFSQFCSKSCGSSGKNNGMFGKKGGDSPNYGKVRTDEHKRNYSLAARKRWVDYRESYETTYKSNEYREMQANAQYRSYETKPGQREKRKVSVNRFWSADTEETRIARKNASEHAIKLLNEGKIGPQAPFKTQWITNPFTGKEEYMHSSWELAFLEKCIKEQYPVTKVHELRIQYIGSDGHDRTYVPDFIGIEENVVFEVKGHMTENDKCKLNALRIWAEKNQFEIVLIESLIT